MPDQPIFDSLRPTTQCASLRDGTQARLHDPLWILGRQWQTGECFGDDGGSPINAQVAMEYAPLSRWCPGASGTPQPLTDNAIPLETLVEREPVAPTDKRSSFDRVQAGMHFLRLLHAMRCDALAPVYLAAYPFQRAAAADESASELEALMEHRVPDPALLYRDLSAILGPQGDRGLALPATPAIPQAYQLAMLNAARSWVRWYRTQGLSTPELATSPPAAWNPSRMEYAFAVSAKLGAAEVVLNALEYTGGQLDWHSFVLDSTKLLGATNATQTVTFDRLPVAVSYRGMPSVRFWEMENGEINLAAIEADPNDPARMMVVEFALVHSNDWFLIPLELPAGTISRIKTLRITDTFGQTSTCRSALEIDGAAASWGMFRVSTRSGAPTELLFLPPTIPATLESSAVEEVLFIRDEMANLGWAIENAVQDGRGGPVDRNAVVQRHREANPEPVPARTADYMYRLGTNVPENWFPLLPQQLTVAGKIEQRLRLGAMPAVTSGSLAPLLPAGRLLSEDSNLLMYDEEVPAEGARVTRTWQFARGSDGSSHVWLGRRKQAGRGPGSSGLRFDALA